MWRDAVARDLTEAGYEVVATAADGGQALRVAGPARPDLAAAAGLLAAGHDVIVFPEGTRSRDGEIGEFHRGAARLAALAGVPLVPAGITGTRTLLPPGASFHRAVVAICIGNSMIMAGSGRYEALSGHDHERGRGGRAREGTEEATAEARARVVALVAGGTS